MAGDEEFTRTVCGCDECVRCCRHQPGFLVHDDIARIAEVLVEPVERRLAASPGAIVGKEIDGVLVVGQIGSIAPKTNSDGSCTFLKANGRCAIHAVSPFGCRMFDPHMADDEASKRLEWGTKQLFDRRYQAIRDSLDRATWWKGRPIKDGENV